MRAVDAAIVGAGVVGAAIAYALSRSTRLRVVVIERGTPGCEASGAAAGILGVATARARGGALFELRRRSAAMFPELVAALQEETGIDLRYRAGALLSLAFSEAEELSLADLVALRVQQGLCCQPLDRSQVLSAEPAVKSHVRAGALFADDCTIDSQRLVSALVAGAQRRGVEFRLHTALQSMSCGGEAVRLQCAGEALEAGVAIVAAGAWSAGVLAPCGVKVPLRPARGEMIALRRHAGRLHHAVVARDSYLVPHDDEVRVGATTTFSGFDKNVSAEGVEMLLRRAEEVLSDMHGARPERAWAGLRPCSTIRRPIIARLPAARNVILATGHHKSGVLLAPVTAQLVAEMVTGVAGSVPLQPFDYRRR